MRNKILTGLASLMLMFSLSTLKADVNVGASVLVGQLDTSGSETEKTDLGGAADKNTKSLKETFYGASVFLEYVADNGFALGIDYVPVSFDIGSGSRTDTTAANDDDSGTRTASAELEDLITVYTHIPFGGNGLYGILGIHFAEITTQETLPASTYGNENIYGGQFGVGYASGNLKYDLFYSDFEDISLASTSGSSVVTADADALTLRVSYGF